MLFKLAIKNLRKSVKDYAIYFMTLVVAVALFYMFNSMDSQTAYMKLTTSKKEMLQTLVEIMDYISKFVAVIFGLLIVYANRFLINRRKKEFGLYMILGMKRLELIGEIFFEMVSVGVISLGVGLFAGAFGSQLMSVVIGKLFECDMGKYKFVFSVKACQKTIVLFVIIYAIVFIFSMFSISRYKLINLLHAEKKNERVVMRNPILSVVVFTIALVVLIFSYKKILNVQQISDVVIAIICGAASTFFLVWSFAGMVLTVAKKIKGYYYKDVNVFVIRQLNNKINTTVVSMTVICLMLFFTIGALSTSFALRDTVIKNADELSKSDVYFDITGRIPKKYKNKSLLDVVDEQGFPKDRFKNSEELSVYCATGVNILDCIADEEMQQSMTESENGEKEEGDKVDVQVEGQAIRFSFENMDAMYLSDYNRLARYYGENEIKLNDDQYAVVADMMYFKDMWDNVLKKADGNPITIAGKTYKSAYKKHIEGMLQMVGMNTNLGFLVVPDNCKLDQQTMKLLVAKYDTSSNDKKVEYSKEFSDKMDKFSKKYKKKTFSLSMTRTNIIESYSGVSLIVVFIAIYVGIVFLISSAAVLSLKQLSESSDNRMRFEVLRKIGCEEKMINGALFKQTAVFFFFPLVLAIIHSVVGIKFALQLLAVFSVGKYSMLPTIISTIVVLVVVYGGYFLATYAGSKRMIQSDI